MDETEKGNVVILVKVVNAYVLGYFITRAAAFIRRPCVYVDNPLQRSEPFPQNRLGGQMCGQEYCCPIHEK